MQPAAKPEDSSSPQAASNAAHLMELAKLFGVKDADQVSPCCCNEMSMDGACKVHGYATMPSII